MSQRRWHVLGAGAMGCLFAGKLSAAGCAVTLLLRQPPAAERAHVRVDSEAGDTRAAVALSANTDSAPIGHLLVATKAPQIAGALAQVAGRLAPGAQVVLAANGMGFVAEARAALAAVKDVAIHCCSTTEGAYRLDALHIRHAGRGLTRLGRPGGGGRPSWYSDWLASGLDCAWLDPIEPALWHKLAINCAINPLTALHHCRNGELLERPALRRQLQSLCDEIAAVSRAAGYPETAGNIHHEAAQVAQNTARNRSSMLQDVASGRSTEIDYITGYLLAEAARHSIPAPLNRRAYVAVRQLEENAPDAPGSGK